MNKNEDRTPRYRKDSVPFSPGRGDAKLTEAINNDGRVEIR